MGGKVAMQLASDFPKVLSSLVVIDSSSADISSYKPDYKGYLRDYLGYAANLNL